MDTKKPKEIKNMPDWKYHGNDTHLSSSQLKYALQDMNKFNAMVNGDLGRYDTPALAFGRAAHTAVLEYEKFDSLYAIFDDNMDMRLKASKEIKKEFDIASKAKKLSVLKKSDYLRICQMRLNIDKYSEARDLLNGGEAEVSYFYTHKNFGLDLKVRPDYVNHELGYIVDFKTSKDASMGSFKRDFTWSYNYDLSAAMYIDGLYHYTGKIYDYYFLVAEKEDPHSVAVYKLGEESYDLGLNKYNKSLEKIIQAKESNVYQLQNRIQEI
tara:strand:+ start:54 stop:857 length:804 start_codon:yes stop_codon:yes gene_type:complete